MDVRDRLGANVKRAREEAGLSQEQLAFEADMHRTYISGIERGRRNPTVVIVERLAAALKTNSASLLG